VPLDLRARVCRYLHEHPQVSWQEFLLDAIQIEIARRELSISGRMGKLSPGNEPVDIPPSFTHR
jgi:hypothetical protein